MVAGPSEILIIAKEGANPRYIAADMMSQAEHDEAASSMLLTTSKRLALEVEKEINIQLKSLSRKEIIEKSLNDYGKIIICNNLDECIKLSNLISPEHLETFNRKSNGISRGDKKCWFCFFRKIYSRANWRLFWRNKSCIANWRNSKIFITIIC